MIEISSGNTGFLIVFLGFVYSFWEKMKEEKKKNGCSLYLLCVYVCAMSGIKIAIQYTVVFILRDRISVNQN